MTRLLVVDDEDNLRSMLDAALRHHGFDVELASNGSEALELVESTQPDLVVLDVMMPGIDGFEVCQRMRAKQDFTPVLFLTARDSTNVNRADRRCRCRAVSIGFGSCR